MKAKWINAFEEDEALSLRSETSEEEEALNLIHDRPMLILELYREWKCGRWVH